MKSLAAIVPLSLLLPTPALACGGFFCDGFSAPIDQAAERIVFGVDPTAGEVTAHVQITYVGEAHEFAWVVPVSAEPDLFLSNDALFNTLANSTIPTFNLVSDVSGTCAVDLAVPASMEDDVDFDTDDGVTVVASELVGPYETVTLQATDAAELVSWLQAHAYEVPNGLDAVLAPYVAANQYFVALRLQSGKSTGDLAPLGMRYAADKASIPIQLTSIAAQPDMPLQVYVLGPSRAVPDNYLHVEINQARIDWYAGGTNYRSVVSQAADEAGGQGFATDFAGPASTFAGRVWQEGSLDLASLRGQSDPIAWLNQVVFTVPASSQLTALLSALVPPPDGVDAASFLGCPSCFEGQVSSEGWDPVAATGALEAGILVPLREAQALIDQSAWVTRLSSSMDAHEMTNDPVFVFNADMKQDQANQHTATSTTHCGLFRGLERGDRTLVLEDGRAYDLPSVAWLDRHDMTELEYLTDVAGPAAYRIVDVGERGDGDVIFDFGLEGAARGCDHGGGAPFGVAALAGLALVARRRR